MEELRADSSSTPHTEQSRLQFSTFLLGDRLYGIDVMKVQEVTRALPMTHVPLSPSFVHGLINLRGQISTAIGLRALFNMSSSDSQQQMNVVCKVGEILLSFLVDQIGDVMEVSSKDFEEPPETIPENIRSFMAGVYKIPGNLLSIIDIQKISDAILKQSKEEIKTNIKN